MFRRVLYLITALLIFIVIYDAIFHNKSNKNEVLIGGKTYFVGIADTPDLQEKGLSGRRQLETNEGMLFVFDKPDKYGFWMKDMLFPIDIIWISDKYTVVYIEKSLLPNTYPQIFTPDIFSKYVLEVTAGEAEKLNIKIGDSVQFLKK